jgi:hypothetical protein
MAQAQVIARMTLPQVIEGTPDEIAVRLKQLEGSTRVTLIIPGEEIEAHDRPEGTDERLPRDGMTFRQVFAPSQAGFDETGMSDDELSDYVEAEVRAYRAERRAKEQQGEGARRSSLS